MKTGIVLMAAATFSFGVMAECSFIPIFDGKTMNGWHILDVAPEDKYYATDENFFAKDGAIHCFQSESKKGGLVLSDGKYDDFELLFEFKNAWGCDSGIMIRCNEKGQGIQILNDYLKDGVVGFPFGEGTGGYFSRPVVLNMHDGKVIGEDIYDAVDKDNLLYSIDAKGWNALWKHGDWNRMKIRCVGPEPRIVTWINGVKIMEMDGATYKARGLKDAVNMNWDAKSAWNRKKIQQITGGKGSIAFQIHQGGRWAQGESVQYRNIRIKELK
ncbi:3-keto-disaccharide hydrolase [Pontiella agarivorans]|uniref:DUF1080 domain-containing protein n=1 Tax=Pontiella agarivorans TaxID=3038953 RepID=A0ABU5MTU6_9BACT|nr:DUF1080 domain-containing protein [Pontiella agarivorans]MDZ8117572.1 DUF1080 domain-containing protein [Pontiella agarivorans]